jgi:hypothetical protein
VIDESKSKSRYGEEFNCEDTHEEEIPTNYKDREKQVDEPLKKDEVADKRITEARQRIASQNIYCSLPQNIAQEYRSFGAYFQWESGDH